MAKISQYPDGSAPQSTDLFLVARSGQNFKMLWSSIATFLASLFAPITKGVTNGDSHDHNGGDGAQINHTTLSSIGTNTHAQLDSFRDWYFTWTVHFDTDPAWSWVNDPTGANGIKTFGSSHFHLQTDDTLAKCFYYQTGSIDTKSLYVMGQIETNCESGIRVDDGSDNNYWELYLEYESAGKIRVYQRVRTGGGAIVETALVTGLPTQKWGLIIYSGGGSLYLYLFKDNANAITYLTSIGSVTPAAGWRYGIFATKDGAGASRGAWWDAWTII